MRTPLRSLLVLTTGLITFIAPTSSHADKVTEGALIMTQDHVTVCANATRDGSSISISNGNKAKVDEALTLEITPNVGYYFDDYTCAAKTFPLTVTRDMLTVVEQNETSNYDPKSGTWTELSTDDSYLNGLRTSGWKVALPHGETAMKITTSVTATGMLSFEYATNIGRSEYGGYVINLLVNGTLVKQYTDYQNLQTTNYNLVCEEEGVSVTKGQTVTWVFNNVNPDGVNRDDVYGYIGNIKVTEEEFDLRDYISSLYTVQRGYPLQMNVDTATVSVTTTRNGETLTLSELSTVFLGETLHVSYTPADGYRYEDATTDTRTFDVELTDDYLNTDAYTFDFNTADQFEQDLGTWTFNETLPNYTLYNYWLKGKTNCWTVEIPCSSAVYESTKRIKTTIPFDGTLSYEYSYDDFAYGVGTCNYFRMTFYSSEEGFNKSAGTTYSDFYGVSNPSPRTVTNTTDVRRAATVYWEYFYAGAACSYSLMGYLGNVRLTSDGSIDLRRSYPTTYNTFLPISANVEGTIISMSTTRDGEDVMLQSGDLTRPGERIFYSIIGISDYVDDDHDLLVGLYHNLFVEPSMRDTTGTVALKAGSDLTAVSGTWTTLSYEDYYQNDTYHEGMSAPLAAGDFTTKSVQATVPADGQLTYAVAVNNEGKFAAYGSFDVSVFVNGVQQRTYREFKDAAPSSKETYSYVEPGVEVKKGDVVRWDFTRLTDGNDADDVELACYVGNVLLSTKQTCYNVNSKFPTLHKNNTLIVPTDTTGRCTSTVTVVRDGETKQLTDGSTFRRYEQLTLTLTLGDAYCWDDNQGDQKPKTFTYDATQDYVPSAIRDTINAYYARVYCHHAFDNGICTRCGYYGKPNTSGGVFYLGNAGDLLYFSDYVNGKIDGTKHPSTDAYIVDDIDLTGIDYTPIGDAESDAYFSGSFLYAPYNTLEYTITLDLKGGEYTGLISVAKGATINNLTIAGSVTGTNYVGAFVGKSLGVTINNCTNKATVKDTKRGLDCAGGFVGLHEDGTLTISHSENYGTVSTYCWAGGFVGRSTAESTGAVAIDHCANHATVYAEVTAVSLLNASHFIGSISDGTATITSCYNSSEAEYNFANSSDRGIVTLTNCYNNNSFDTSDGITVYTAKQAASGELCFKLNGSQATFSDMNYWTQRLGSDPLPTLIKDSDSKARTVNKVVVTRIKQGEDAVDVPAYCNTEDIVLNDDPTVFCILKSADESERVTNLYIDFNLNWGLVNGCNTLVHTPSYKDSYYCPNAVLVDSASYAITTPFRAASLTYSRTINSAGYSTFILPFSVDASAVNGKVFKLTDFTDGTLIFERVESTVEANTPYLIRTTEDSLSLLNASLQSVDVEAMTPSDITVSGLTHRGTYVTERGSAAERSDATLYGYKGGQFWKLNGRYVLKPFRTMIEASASAAVRPATLGISVDGEITGLVTPELESTTVDVYSLDGRRLRTAVPSISALRGLPQGTYIVGGQKVIKH